MEKIVLFSDRERSQAVRKELKGLGLKRHQYSIKSRNCSATTVIIKDLSIDKDTIEKALLKFESISYDNYTGEILQGANIYIFVEYDWKILADATEANKTKAKEIIQSSKESHLVLEDGKVLVFFRDNYRGQELFNLYMRTKEGLPEGRITQGTQWMIEEALARRMALLNGQIKEIKKIA